MSQRAIRRAQQKKLAAEQRRESIRRRRAMAAAGAAIGATALFAPSAQAANLVVSNLLDDGSAGSLRDAITTANSNGEADDITFQSGLTGTIRLTTGELPVTEANPLTITGPAAGADPITISGDANDNQTADSGDSRIFNVTSASPFSLSNLTLTNGYSNQGGAILGGASSNVTITDSSVTGSKSTGTGGAIATTGTMTINDTTLSGNTATGLGGAIAYGNGANPPPSTAHGLDLAGDTFTGNHSNSSGGALYSGNNTTISDTTLSGNTATTGGAVQQSSKYGSIDIANSTLSGNTAATSGGGIYLSGKNAPLTLSDSVVSGNTATSGNGGGISVSATSGKYSNAVRSTISGTTIDGNHAAGTGAGLRVARLKQGDRLGISHSTISGNGTTGPGGGGGIQVGEGSGSINGDFTVTDSTVSGNSAPVGAGASIGTNGGGAPLGANGSVAFENSTIAANTAATHGGGLYLNAYTSGTGQSSPSADLTSTIVADNSANGVDEDLDRADGSTGGGFNASFSLIENKGDAPVTEDPSGPDIIGTDPKLGALANNGGPTQTMLPATDSAAIDQGDAPARLTTDQRGEKRTVDGSGVANPAGGDGTDIGAVELGAPASAPPPDTGPPQPQPTPPPPVTTMDLPPIALIQTNGLRSHTAAGRRVKGTASDDRNVVKVQVALVSKHGGKCRDLLRAGRFSSSHRCGPPRSFIDALGTKTWSFKLEGRLKKGYYVVYARATDDGGHTQKTFGTKSRRPFRVR